MSHDMPMHPTTIRFAPDALALVQAAARSYGCSVSQFVREAAIMRAMVALEDPVAKQAADGLAELRNDPRTQSLARGKD